MISKQTFSLNFMFLYSLIEELRTKEENAKIGRNFNFGHECIFHLLANNISNKFISYLFNISLPNSDIIPVTCLSSSMSIIRNNVVMKTKIKMSDINLLIN